MSLPHARGGVSAGRAPLLSNGMSSPRPWGCFHRSRQVPGPARVFPTPVGVFPGSCRSRSSSSGLPHARGGVSQQLVSVIFICGSSPRPWGCFWLLCSPPDCGSVFPTPVGVFLNLASMSADLQGLPHARGGVSSAEACKFSSRKSSPRPWGCFSVSAGRLRTVFPTPVGVFLSAACVSRRRSGLPHARGGVSHFATSDQSF